MLIFVEDDSSFAAREDERAQEYWASWTAYVGELTASGIVRSAAALQPSSTASTVRVRDGRRTVQDGPFADSKEALGGFFVIDVPDLDAALEWAEKSPSSKYGSTEVRPVLPMQS
jgi:hypothetical protein